MKRVSLTKIQAESFVRCWLANGVIGACELPEECKSIPFHIFIRRLIPVWNHLANNALWDGHPNKAYLLLLKYGLGKERRQVSEEFSYSRRKYRAHQMAHTAWREEKAKTNVGPVARTVKRVR